jgi:hypothetical protein
MDEISLPLKIRPMVGAFCIEDANRRPVSYTYFKDDGLAKSDHWNEKQARSIAQVIARMMTDRLER